jgi:pimeloyl-ACP methyl ester carboxylesterase
MMPHPLTDSFFDRSGHVRRPPWGALVGEVRALLFDHPASPDPAHLPRGDGRVVMVIPAFLTGDRATAPFRRFLQACGYRAVGWELGVNWGPTPRILGGLRRRLEALRDLQDGPICVVGISLGGLLARDLAHSHPDDVRQVVTLASPYRLPTAATIEPLFHLMARFYSHDIDLVRLARPLTVPELNVFTRDDGVVAWQTCRPDDAPGEAWVAHEVRGAHLTICRNPQAMAAVVRRLAMPRTP